MTGLVLDTSAAVAILLGEPASDELLDAIDAAEERLVGAPTVLELGIVIEARLGAPRRSITERFVADGGFDVVPFGPDEAAVAMSGWRRFGRGRHRAALNLGDCCTYAIGIASGLPVLCVGDDFPHPDVAVLPLGPSR